MRGAVDLSSLVDRPAPPAPGAPGGPGGEAVTVPGLVMAADDRTFGPLLELSRVVPVVVVLWSQRAPESSELVEAFERQVTQRAGSVVLAPVEAETSPQLVQSLQAQAVPTAIAIVGGQPVPLFQGTQPEDVIGQLLDQLAQLAAQNGVSGRVHVDGADPAEEAEPEPLPPLHQEAYDAIDRGDFAAAVTAYKTAIAQNPRDALAVAGLAQVSLLARLQGATADEIRAAAAAAPQDADAQLAVADLDLSGGHVPDAFDRLLGLFPSLAQEDKNRLRERLLEYFEIVGVEDPRVIAARRRLTNLLF
nr:tetratricopeptide repeat protein [Agromyces seonyuensis]